MSLLRDHKLQIVLVLIAGVGCFYYLSASNRPAKILEIELPKEVVVEGKPIPLAWTDDNEGEGLVIQTDQKTYFGFNSAEVYFSVTNRTDRDQDANIAFLFEDRERRLEGIERIGGYQEGGVQVGDLDQADNLERLKNPDIKRKDVKGFAYGKQASDQIEAGATHFYRAKIAYAPQTDGEFFIEAFGDRGAYGHLDPWYSSNWGYRKTVTIQSSQCATTTSDFVVLATTTDANLKYTSFGGHVASSTGGDILFTASDGSTLLNYQREKYSSSTGELVAWIKTGISSSANTVLYMYYGNASASSDQATTTGVWDTNYKAVYHLNDRPANSGTYYDSTQYANNAVFHDTDGDSSTNATGKAGIAVDLNGDADFIDAIDSTSLRIAGSFTISAWVNMGTLPGSSLFYGIINKGDVTSETAGQNENYGMFVDNGLSGGGYNAITFFEDSSATDYTSTWLNCGPSANTWYHVFGVHDAAADTLKFYLNGVQRSTTTGVTATPDTGNQALEIGDDGDNFSGVGDFFDGMIDEVRIQAAARSKEWIQTEYNNQNNVGAFLTFGSEEASSTALSQSAYRWFANANSTNVGSALAAQDTATVTPAQGTAFRLRLLLHATSTFGIGAENFKLQYAERGVDKACDASFSGETYADVATSSGAIRFYDNTTPADGATSTANGSDPAHSGHTTYQETYEESNNFTSTSSISAGGDGLWDFALVNYSAATGTTYCFKAVKSSGASLDSYAVLPEITTSDLLVSAVGYQEASIPIPSASRHVGGAFSIGANLSSATVTSITITESGTVDASASLDNIKLFYEMDSSLPYDCASESYAGTETQFGSDDTDGFSSANGTSTFSGSVSISATSTMCVYAVLDVLSSASSGNTLEIGIANPSTDVSASGKSAGPSAAVSISGSTALSGPVTSAKDFISIVDPGNGTGADYTSLSAWESAVQCDLTAANTLVFSWGTASGTIPDGVSVMGNTSGASGTLVHMTATTTLGGSAQALVKGISGTFQSGEQVSVFGLATSSYYAYFSDTGTSAIAVAKCRTTDGSADDDPVQLTGWTTSTSTYIKIWTDPDDEFGRHKGVWDSSKYWMDAPAINSTEMIDIREEYTKIEGLQVRNANLTVDNILAIYGDVGTGEIVIKDNILKGNDTIYWYDEAIRFENNSGSMYILNNIIYDWGSENSDYGAFTSGIIGNTYIFNNTIQNCAAGLNAPMGSVYAINNIIKGTYYNARTYIGTFASGSDYNSTDGTDTMSGGGSHNLAGQSISFENEIGDDFHLASTDTGAKNNGTSTVGLSPLYQEGCPQGGVCYDIDRTARGSAYDIGADELATEFVSTICESSSAGGGCSNLDYNTLSRWEDKVEADLSASTTRVFSGYRTGSLSEDDTVALYTAAGVSLNATGTVVATTSAGQVLVDGIYGTSTPVTTASGTRWRKDASNYFSVQGTGDALGASPIAVAKIDGAWTASDTVSVLFQGWVTDHDNYIKAYTTSLARHAGKWDYGKYRLVANDYNGSIDIRSGDVVIDGLQLQDTSTEGTNAGITLRDSIQGMVCILSNNIIKDSGTGVYLSNNSATDKTLRVYNNILYDNVYGFYLDGGDYDKYIIDNNSLINSRYNATFYGDNDTFIFLNNIMQGAASNYYVESAGATHFTSNNISQDATSPDGASWQNKTVNFISTSTKDFHLASTDTAAKDKGADLSATSTLSFTTDIDGFTRPYNSVWDVGADEYSEATIYRSVSPGVTSALQCGGGSNAMSVSTSTSIAAFASAMASQVGVGDALVYNGSSSILFISGRSSSTVFTVKTAGGLNPTTATTTDTRWCIFRAYTSLDNAVGSTNSGTENTGIPSAVRDFDTWTGGRDLVTNSEQWNIACYASTSPDTTAVTIDGWTTSATRYLKIYTPTAASEVGTSQRHAGKWDDAKYRLYHSAGTSPLSINDNHVRIDGLQISSITENDHEIDIRSQTAGTDIRITNNIITINGALDVDSVGIWIGDSDIVAEISNNVIYGVYSANNGGAGISFADAFSTTYLYNNTIYGCDEGFQNDTTDATVIAVNNISYGNTDNWSGNFHSSSHNNISGPDQGDAPGSSPYNNATILFVDSANDDFHLDPHDTVAINTGTSSVISGQGAVSGELQYDIDGDLRRTAAVSSTSPTSIDIGADEAEKEYIAVVDPGGGSGHDFDSLSEWEGAIQSNIATSSTLVFSYSTASGTIPDLATVIGESSGATATSVHMTATTTLTGSAQLLFTNIKVGTSTGSGFKSGEKVYVYGASATANYVYLSSSGDSVVATAKCRTSDGSADETTVTIDGWTTGAKNYVKVWTDPDEYYRHNGVWDEGRYRIEHTTTDTWQWTIGIDAADNVRIDGLQVLINYGHGSSNGIFTGGAPSDSQNNENRVSNCLVKGRSSTNSTLGLGISNNSSGLRKLKIFNNIIYGFKDLDNTSGIGLNLQGTSDSNNQKFYNNTVYGCYEGIADGAWHGGVAVNNISYNNTDNYTGTFSSNAYNNLSGPRASDTDAPGSNPQNAKVVHFADQANYDFHLDSADTAARGKGTSTLLDSGSEAGMTITDDIDGNTRPLTTGIDIGADQVVTRIYRSVGPGATGALSAGATSGNLEIAAKYLAGSTTSIADYVATFWGELPTNVGVGDAIEYDKDNGGSVDSIAFVVKRYDNSHYSVRTATGSAPYLTTAPDADWSVFRAYQSLSDAEGGTENASINNTVEQFDADWSGSGGRDLVTNSEQWSIACYANGTTADTAAVVVDGWTTAEDNYMRIFTPTSENQVGVTQRHAGKWDDTKYSHKIGATASNNIDVNDDYVSIDGLQIESSSSDNNTGVYSHFINTSNQLFISNNIIRRNASHSGTDMQAIVVDDAEANTYAFNNLIYDFTSSWGVGISVASGYNSYIYGNTVVECSRMGIGNQGTNATIKNNIVQTASPSIGNYFGSFNTDSAYNISQDATSPNTSLQNIAVQFMSTTTDDFHLSPLDFGARNRGADLTNDMAWRKMMFDDAGGGPPAGGVGGTDIDDGDTSYNSFTDDPSRPYNTLWDIGADEAIIKQYRSVAPLETGSISTGGTLTVASSTGTATFSTAQPDNIGVGDAIVYNSSSSLAFIVERASSTVYTARTATGTLPTYYSGTSFTIYRAYTSLYNAERGVENTGIPSALRNFDNWTAGGDATTDDVGQDIASTSEQWNIAAYAGSATSTDTTTVVVDGWTTAPENHIRVFTPSLSTEVGASERHQGKWDSTKYIFSHTATGDWDYGFGISESYFRMEGLQIEYNDSGNPAYSALMSAILIGTGSDNNELHISGNIIRSISPAGGNGSGIIMYDTLYTQEANVYNNIIYDFNLNGINFQNQDSSRIYNNTIYNCGNSGYQGGNGDILKNNISFASGNADYSSSAYVSPESANNASSDDTGDDNNLSGGLIYQSASANFIDVANRDFHLKPDAPLRGAGISSLSLPGEGWGEVGYDIDGQSRSLITDNRSPVPDIGADQAATPIYRSIAPSKTDSLASGGVSNSLSISTDFIVSGSNLMTATATFYSALPDNVGVGDVLVYNSSSSIAFISGRSSSTVYTLQTREGGTPPAFASSTSWAIYRAYTSLSNAEAGIENTSVPSALRNFDPWTAGGTAASDDLGKDIYTANQQWNIAAYANGTTADGGVSISGWTTYPSDYLKIYTPVSTSEAGISQRHRGKWDESKYYAKLGTNYGAYINVGNVWLDGIQYKQITSSGNTATIRGAFADRSAFTKISNNIFWANCLALTGTNYCYAIGNSYVVQGPRYIWNNIIYGYYSPNGGTSYGLNLNTNTNFVYNNTIVNSHRGVYQNSADVILKNNIVFNNIDNYISTFSPLSANNLSGPTQTDAPGSNPINAAAVRFLSTASGTEDFHLSHTDTSARNAGADVSGELSPLYQEGCLQGGVCDIDGHLRSTTTASGAWDIGADESALAVYRSVGPGASDGITSFNDGDNNMTISGNTASFQYGLPDDVGVGDAIQYDSDGNASIDSIAFISGRTDTVTYTVASADGGAPNGASDSSNWQIYRAYTSLADAVAQDENASIDAALRDFDSSKDLFTANENLNIACYAGQAGAADTDAVVIDGYDTNGPNYIRIYTPFETSEVGISQRHAGKWDDGKYRLEVGGATGIMVSDGNARVEGLQIYKTTDTEDIGGIQIRNNTDAIDARISNNIIKSVLTPINGWQYGIASYNNSPGGKIKLYNNIIYDINGSWGNVSCMLFNDPNSTHYVYNNSLYGCYTGINRLNPTVIAKNNITQNCTDGYTGTFDSSSDFNISDIAGDAPNATYSTAAKTVKFVDATNDDFHLAPDDASAIDNGTTTEPWISASAGMTDGGGYDIDGQRRRSPDIGADEASQYFVSSIKYSGGDFSSLSQWEAANQVDLTATTTAVYSISSASGTIPIGSSVIGETSGARASTTVISTSSMQALLYNITASSTGNEFSGGEKLYLSGSSPTAYYIILATSSAANPPISVAQIDGTWSSADTNAVTIDGWTTGVNNYIKIYTTSAARHQGKWDERKYRRELTDGAGISIYEDFMVIDGLQIKITANNNNYNYGLVSSGLGSGAYIEISNNLIRGELTGTSFSNSGITANYYSSGSVRVWKIWNNIVYGFSGAGGAHQCISGNSGGSSYSNENIYNNTVYECTTGFFGGLGAVLKNNIAYDSADNYYGTSFHASSTNNLSGPTQADAPGTNPQNAKTVVFADEANKDFHLSPLDTSARNAGTSTISNPLLGGAGGGLVSDIDGTARGAAYDIGADEVPVEYVSTICENTAAGGGCANLDYNTLARWEDKVETNLASSTTRVFSGTLTGSLSENNTVTLYRGASSMGATGYVVATTSAGQLLVDGITITATSTYFPILTGGISPQVSCSNGDVWRKDGSNYFTVSGTYDQLGASPIAVAKIDGTWAGVENSGFNIHGWSTSRDNYIKIYTKSLARHNCNLESGYRIISNNSNAAVGINEQNVWIDGLNAQSDDDSSGYAISVASTHFEANTTDIRLSNNLVYVRNPNGGYGMYLTHLKATEYRVWNNMLYSPTNTTNIGMQMAPNGESFSGPAYIYNNTIYNFRWNIYVYTSSNPANVILKNNIAVGGGQYDYRVSGGYPFASSSDYNISSNGSAPGAHSMTGKTINDLAFFSTVPGSEDLHLSINSIAKHAGASLLNDPWIPASSGLTDQKWGINYDIDGETRTGSWSIGADEYSAIKINSTELMADAMKKGLVLHYTFDGSDISGSTTIDRSPYGNNGTIASNPNKVSGKRGQALEFDGGDDYIDIESPGSLDDIQANGSGLTVGLWLNASDEYGGQPGLVSKGNENVEGFWDLFLDYDDGIIRFFKDFGTLGYGQDLSIKWNMPSSFLGEWKHLILTWNGTSSADGVHLYVNGSEISKDTIQNGTGSANSDANLDLMIAVKNIQYYKGSMDDIRIYNYAFSAAEAGNLYRAGQVKFSVDRSDEAKKGLVGYWSFNGPDIDWSAEYEIKDRSGYGNDAWVTGLDASSAVSGKIGQALDFGNAGYVEAHYDAVLNTQDAVSVSAWIKTSDTRRAGIVTRASSVSPFSGYVLALAPNYGGCGTAGYVGFWTGDNSNYYLCSTSAVNDDQWHHLIGTYDGTTARIYIDGQQNNSDARSNGLDNTDSDLNIGIDYLGTGNRINGKIDEVRIYNYSLSENEIRDLYNQGKVRVRK